MIAYLPLSRSLHLTTAFPFIPPVQTPSRHSSAMAAATLIGGECAKVALTATTAGHGRSYAHRRDRQERKRCKGRICSTPRVWPMNARLVPVKPRHPTTKERIGTVIFEASSTMRKATSLCAGTSPVLLELSTVVCHRSASDKSSRAAPPKSTVVLGRDSVFGTTDTKPMMGVAVEPRWTTRQVAGEQRYNRPVSGHHLSRSHQRVQISDAISDAGTEFQPDFNRAGCGLGANCSSGRIPLSRQFPSAPTRVSRERAATESVLL